MGNTEMGLFEKMPEISRIGSFSFLLWAILIGVFLSLVVNMGANQPSSWIQVSSMVCLRSHSQRCHDCLALHLDLGAGEHERLKD